MPSSLVPSPSWALFLSLHPSEPTHRTQEWSAVPSSLNPSTSMIAALPHFCSAGNHITCSLNSKTPKLSRGLLCPFPHSLA